MEKRGQRPFWEMEKTFRHTGWYYVEALRSTLGRLQFDDTAAYVGVSLALDFLCFQSLDAALWIIQCFFLHLNSHWSFMVQTGFILSSSAIP